MHVSSAFDMVDHNILLQCLETSFSLHDFLFVGLDQVSERTHMLIPSDGRTLRMDAEEDEG